MSLNRCRNRLGIMMFAVALTGLPLTAQAAAPSEVDDVVSYTFDDDLVGGDTVSPTLEVLQVRRRGERESLIRVREHFVRELCKSVEQL